MSKKWIIEPFKLMTAGDMSGNLLSDATNIKRLDNLQFDYGCFRKWPYLNHLNRLIIQHLRLHLSLELSCCKFLLG